MLTPKDIEDSNNQTGYRYVQRVGGQPSRARVRKTYYQAIKRVAPGTGHGKKWTGPGRMTALEAAQDYCDWHNNLAVSPAKPALKSAGHARGTRSRLSDDPEVEAALGVLRDARGRRRGNQGYVYCIWEYKDGGGMEYVKVGFSTNPQARVAELQTGNPRPLKLISMKEGTLEDEAALHAKYIKENVLQEWFRPTKELLLEFDLDSEGKPFDQRVASTPGNLPA